MVHHAPTVQGRRAPERSRARPDLNAERTPLLLLVVVVVVVVVWRLSAIKIVFTQGKGCCQVMEQMPFSKPRLPSRACSTTINSRFPSKLPDSSFGATQVPSDVQHTGTIILLIVVAGRSGGKFPAPTEDLLNHPEHDPEYRLGIRISTPYVPSLAKFTCPSESSAVITG